MLFVMRFEEYLQVVARKVGPNAAFDLARDARIQALEKLLVKKGLAFEEDIEKEQFQQFDAMAKQIINMPPMPGKQGPSA